MYYLKYSPSEFFGNKIEDNKIYISNSGDDVISCGWFNLPCQTLNKADLYSSDKSSTLLFTENTHNFESYSTRFSKSVVLKSATDDGNEVTFDV